MRGKWKSAASMALPLALLLFIGGAALSAKKSAPAVAPGAAAGPFDSLYQRYGARYGVDWRLVKAHALVENAPQDVNAVNEDDDESIGLMQVLCQPDGAGGCRNRFDIDGWDGITRAALFDPDTNIKMGAQILAWNVKTYGLPKGVAVYNAWDQRNAPAAGPFKNQYYVDRVRSKARELGLVF